jgi:hypothetical protein
VIDSTDIERLGIAADELAAMLNEEELRDAALLVFANKQDQPGAKGAGEISEALKLGELRDRNWSIVACSAIDGKGINEGMDWLVVSSSLFACASPVFKADDGSIANDSVGECMNKGVMAHLMTLLCNSINSPGVFFRYPTFCICRDFNHRCGL